MPRKLNFLLSFILMLALTGSLTAQVDPGTDNLTHSWTFDDGTANDYVGDAHGTIVGDAVIGDGAFTAWEVGQCLELPADVIALIIYDEVTLEVWFTPPVNLNTDHHMLVYFGDANSQNYGSDSYFISPARGDDFCRTAISCGQQSNPWEAEDGANGPELDDGVLHHVVSTLDAMEIKLYIDSEYMDADTLGGDNNIANISLNHAWLANGGYTADPTWLGSIHEFNIYNRVLNEEEVVWLNEHDPWTGVDEDEIVTLPNTSSLSQNYPNPFNPTTTISYRLSKTGHVELTVFDLLGKEVATLVNTTQNPGEYSVTFNGEELGSGIYFYQLKTGEGMIIKRMVLTK